MSNDCFPDSLIGNIPNLYYYAANNPSEATIAKRRSYAETISYQALRENGRGVQIANTIMDKARICNLDKDTSH